MEHKRDTGGIRSGILTELRQLHRMYFQCNGHAYPLDIIVAHGQHWLTSRQVGRAFGNGNLKQLIGDLLKGDDPELMKGKHYRILDLREFGNHTLPNPQDGDPNVLVLSYRGIIRVSMHSEGTRANIAAQVI